MAKKTEYLVVREHEGDRFYAVGDTRIAAANEVKHLVPHVLEEVGDAADEVETEGETPSPKVITAPKGKGK